MMVELGMYFYALELIYIYIYIYLYIQRKFLWGGGTLEKSLGESVECLYAKKQKRHWEFVIFPLKALLSK